MKRINHTWEQIISDDNLYLAIADVNRSHRWGKGHKPNMCTYWAETHKEEAREKLRTILENGFVQQEPRSRKRYDPNAQKWRNVCEPMQWPDQYVHHALIQVLMPVMMRGMDPYCCGSIRGRGTSQERKAIQRWMRTDKKGTKYCMQLDIRHFYDSISSEEVLKRMRQLVKDHRTLDLVERITKGGILIGAYTSQWFANTMLQPMDQMIRQNKACKHYCRYMDNLTIFGSNKRKLHRLRAEIEKWLICHGLELKGDWQIYPVNSRLPSAVGYRYGRNYTIPRKHTLFRIKRQIARYRKKQTRGGRIPFRMASGMLSRLSILRHCNNTNLYRSLFNGQRIQRELKQVIRVNARERSDITWNMFLEQEQTRRKLSKQKAPRTAS